jgi:hypothetical protein
MIDSSQMSDWITVTLPVDGYKQRVRRSAVLSYGTYPATGSGFIDLAGRLILVRESQIELALLIEDDVLSK